MALSGRQPVSVTRGLADPDGEMAKARIAAGRWNVMPGRKLSGDARVQAEHAAFAPVRRKEIPME